MVANRYKRTGETITAAKRAVKSKAKAADQQALRDKLNEAKLQEEHERAEEKLAETRVQLTSSLVIPTAEEPKPKRRRKKKGAALKTLTSAMTPTQETPFTISDIPKALSDMTPRTRSLAKERALEAVDQAEADLVLARSRAHIDIAKSHKLSAAGQAVIESAAPVRAQRQQAAYIPIEQRSKPKPKRQRSVSRGPASKPKAVRRFKRAKHDIPTDVAQVEERPGGMDIGLEEGIGTPGLPPPRRKGGSMTLGDLPQHAAGSGRRPAARSGARPRTPRSKIKLNI